MRRTRRDVLKLATAAGAAAVMRPLQAEVQRPAIPYVDGLSFLSPDPADVERSGPPAFILDASSVGPLKTTDVHRAGFTPSDVEKIVGGNWARVLRSL